MLYKRKFRGILGMRSQFRSATELWRAKQLIYGDVIEQYRRLGDYAEIVRVTNPGSWVKLEIRLETVTGEQEESTVIAPLPKEIVVFQYMYIRFGQQK